jgi:predicted dehydrogenase
MERVRVAILGCGRIADLQCLGYLDHPRAELHAVCDRDEARALPRSTPTSTLSWPTRRWTRSRS